MNVLSDFIKEVNRYSDTEEKTRKKKLLEYIAENKDSEYHISLLEHILPKKTLSELKESGIMESKPVAKKIAKTASKKDSPTKVSKTTNVKAKTSKTSKTSKATKATKTSKTSKTQAVGCWLVTPRSPVPSHFTLVLGLICL